MNNLFLAADSGGSKTIWRVLNSNGETVEQVYSEGLADDMPGTLLVDEIVLNAFELLRRTDYPSIFLSLGGPNTREVEKALRACWSNATITVVREASGDAILNAASFLGCSSVVLCGTGSTAVGIKKGHKTFAGGWGAMYADGGSGGGLCRDALALFLRSLDGSGEDSALSPVFDFITEGLDISDFTQRMEAKRRALSLSRRELAAFLPHIYTLYLQMVPTAVELFNNAVEEVCRLAAGVTDDDPSAKVLVCGGFFRNKPELVELCQERFSTYSSAKLLYENRFDPITGACIAALEAGNIHIDKNIFENILNEKMNR